VERRNSTRYRLQAPVIFRWTDSRGGSHQQGGFTRDISTRGAFIFCESPPPLQAGVTVDVMLPFLGNARKSISMTTGGFVLRVEGRDERTGFAIAGDFSCGEPKYPVQ